MFEEKEQILDDMIKPSSVIEDGMREDFARFDEAFQAMLLGNRGSSSYKDRDWWYWMFMGGPRHRDRPTI